MIQSDKQQEIKGVNTLPVPPPFDNTNWSFLTITFYIVRKIRNICEYEKYVFDFLSDFSKVYPSISFFWSFELGSKTGRPHLHMIFNTSSTLDFSEFIYSDYKRTPLLKNLEKACLEKNAIDIKPVTDLKGLVYYILKNSELYLKDSVKAGQTYFASTYGFYPDYKESTEVYILFEDIIKHPRWRFLEQPRSEYLTFWQVLKNKDLDNIKEKQKYVLSEIIKNENVYKFANYWSLQAQLKRSNVWFLFSKLESPFTSAINKIIEKKRVGERYLWWFKLLRPHAPKVLAAMLYMLLLSVWHDESKISHLLGAYKRQSTTMGARLFWGITSVLGSQRERDNKSKKILSNKKTGRKLSFKLLFKEKMKSFLVQKTPKKSKELQQDALENTISTCLLYLLRHLLKEFKIGDFGLPHLDFWKDEETDFSSSTSAIRSISKIDSLIISDSANVATIRYTGSYTEELEKHLGKRASSLLRESFAGVHLKPMISPPKPWEFKEEQHELYNKLMLANIVHSLDSIICRTVVKWVRHWVMEDYQHPPSIVCIHDCWGIQLPHIMYIRRAYSSSFRKLWNRQLLEIILRSIFAHFSKKYPKHVRVLDERLVEVLKQVDDEEKKSVKTVLDTMETYSYNYGHLEENENVHT